MNIQDFKFLASEIKNFKAFGENKLSLYEDFKNFMPNLLYVNTNFHKSAQELKNILKLQTNQLEFTEYFKHKLHSKDINNQPDIT